MIKIENLTKIFRTEEVETTALNGISIDVKDGEFVAVMGPSGCGKSTLLNILGLLDNPNEGKYWLGEEEVSQLKEKDRTRFRKGRIGFVFQSFNLIEELTVEENIELQLKYLGVSKAERKLRRDVAAADDTAELPDDIIGRIAVDDIQVQVCALAENLQSIHLRIADVKGQRGRIVKKQAERLFPCKHDKIVGGVE